MQYMLRDMGNPHVVVLLVGHKVPSACVPPSPSVSPTSLATLLLRDLQETILAQKGRPSAQVWPLEAARPKRNRSREQRPPPKRGRTQMAAKRPVTHRCQAQTEQKVEIFLACYARNSCLHGIPGKLTNCTTITCIQRPNICRSQLHRGERCKGTLICMANARAYISSSACKMQCSSTCIAMPRWQTP